MKISTQIFEIIAKNTSEKELAWLKSKIENPTSLPIAFVAVPRFVSKNKISNENFIQDTSLKNWSIDRLVRVYLLLVFEENITIIEFEKAINNLFETAEINESVALYSALPYLKKPENWLLKATDAIRSNIGDVFDSLAFNNPYPAKYFTELAWNQLILKCIFNDKSINNIIGLQNRFNQNLANTFIDFAHERWAAGRSVPPEAWQILEGFHDKNNISDLEFLIKTGKKENQIAAYLICISSTIPEIKQLLTMFPVPDFDLNQSNLSWKLLEN